MLEFCQAIKESLVGFQTTVVLKGIQEYSSLLIVINRRVQGLYTLRECSSVYELRWKARYLNSQYQQ